jgi:hypothetical protein
VTGEKVSDWTERIFDLVTEGIENTVLCIHCHSARIENDFNKCELEDGVVS